MNTQIVEHPPSNSNLYDPNKFFDPEDCRYFLNNYDYLWIKKQRDLTRTQAHVAAYLGDIMEAGYYLELLTVFDDCLEAFKPKAKPIRAGQINVADIKAHCDIIAVVERYTTLKKSGSRFQGLCPLHADKKSPSLVVYPDSQSWHCFGACGRGGDVFDFIMLAEKCDFKQAASVLEGNL